MTKFAFPLPDGSTLGGPYSAEELHTLFHYLVGQKSGIFPDFGDEIVAVAAGSTVVVGTGGASIHGIPIYVTQGEILKPDAIPTVGDTGMVAVVAIEWDAPEADQIDVRLEIKSNADGTATIPSTSDTYGTLIEFPLLSFVMDTMGVISEATDERQYMAMLDIDNFDHGSLKAFGRINRQQLSGLTSVHGFNVTSVTRNSSSAPTQLLDVTFGTSDIAYVMLLGMYPGVVDSWQSDTVVRIKTFYATSDIYDFVILGFGDIPEEEAS